MARGSIASLRIDLSKFLDDDATDELKEIAGMAAKEAALDVAERDLGSDRAFSGFKRRNARLDAGFDIEDGPRVVLNLRPKGLWMLANDGRRANTGKAKGGIIQPGPRAKSSVMRTPWGPRANVKSSKSRGLGTLADAENAVERETFKAVDAALLKRAGRF